INVRMASSGLARASSSPGRLPAQASFAAVTIPSARFQVTPEERTNAGDASANWLADGNGKNSRPNSSIAGLNARASLNWAAAAETSEMLWPMIAVINPSTSDPSQYGRRPGYAAASAVITGSAKSGIGSAIRNTRLAQASSGSARSGDPAICTVPDAD